MRVDPLLRRSSRAALAMAPRLLPRAFAALFSLCCLAATAQVTVAPSAPKPQDIIRVQMPTSEVILQANISMTANKITVALVTPSSDFVLPPPRPPLDVVVGQLPAGEYQVEVTRRFDSSAQTVSLGTTSFSVGQQAPTDPIFNRTDLWWNPNESGWGMNIVQHPSGTIFATWYTYDADQ